MPASTPPSRARRAAPCFKSTPAPRSKRSRTRRGPTRPPPIRPPGGAKSTAHASRTPGRPVPLAPLSRASPRAPDPRMFALGHVGIGRRLVPRYRAFTARERWIFALGALLPDLIDKPLYYIPSWITGKRGAELGLIAGTHSFG